MTKVSKTDNPTNIIEIQLLTIRTAKEKDRKDLMRKRNVDFAVNHRD